MKRVTTPKLCFTIPFDKSFVKRIRLTFKQNDKIVLIKEDEQLQWDDKGIFIKLTQKETKSFSAAALLRAEIHILTIDNDSIKSDPISIRVEEVLNEEVLE